MQQINLCFQAGANEKRVSVSSGTPLREAMQMAGFSFPFPCAGRGTCGNCKIILPEAAVSQADRRFFTENQLRQGLRLACQVICSRDMTVRLPNRSGIQEMDVVSGETPAGAYALAVDVGTTSVVCYLVDCASKSVLKAITQPNAQRSFGTDVISRIQVCMARECGTKQLHECIISQLHDLLAQLMFGIDSSENPPERIVITGNTIMLHLVMGVSPEGLGIAPYTPCFLETQETTSCQLALFPGQDVPIILLPSISAFVGADITAALFQSGLWKTKGPSLLLDIGTNAEMVLIYQGNMVCCSASAGPAFEAANISCGMPAQNGAVRGVSFVNGSFLPDVIGGGEGKGLCGSGLIDLIARLLETGLLRADGCFSPDEETEEFFSVTDAGLSFCLAPDVTLTQEDIRAVQLAKASISAAMELLVAECGLKMSEIEQLVLAGAFGEHVSLQSAARIGLLPTDFLIKTVVIGNAAGDGACQAAANRGHLEKIQELAGSVHAISLAEDPRFPAIFYSNVNFITK